MLNIRRALEFVTEDEQAGSKIAVAGDFNQSMPYAQWYGSRKGEAAMSEAMSALDLLCLTHGTCLQSGRPRIDHICVGREGLGVHPLPRIGCWVVPTVQDKFVTDHTGVCVDLAWVQDENSLP